MRYLNCGSLLVCALLFCSPAEAGPSCSKKPDHPDCTPDGDSSANSGEITGSDGPDNLCSLATADDDRVQGLGGNDTLCGFAGNDNLGGGDGDDLLIGGTGNDTFDTGAGDDTIYAGAGDDRILGDAGNDTIHGDLSDPLEDPGAGGPGEDWISYNSTGQKIHLDFTTRPGTITNVLTGDIDTVTGVEKVTGPLEDDVFYGGPAAEFFGGGRGNDYIHGGPGDDFIGADRGNDVVRGGKGSDRVRGAENSDVFQFHRVDYVANETDIVEDFNIRQDSLLIVDMFVIGVTHPKPGGNGPKADTEATLGDCTGAAVGTIVFWDVTLDESFFLDHNGC